MKPHNKRGWTVAERDGGNERNLTAPKQTGVSDSLNNSMKTIEDFLGGCFADSLDCL